MNTLAIIIDAFHFIRPAFLLMVPVILLVCFIVRRAHGGREVPADGVAPHLREALAVGSTRRTRVQAIDLLAVMVVLLALGAAGPTWSRMPDPLVAQSVPLVVALKVTPSMENEDVAPSRLERGKQKIRDLLKLRAGARTALVAYAGSAHLVLPMTEDPTVMTPYLEGLAPNVMPVKGNRAGEALALATDFLAQENTPGGAILFVADTLDPVDAAALNAATTPVAMLSILPIGKRDRGFDQLSVRVIPVTPDDSDIRAIDRLLNAAYRQAMLENIAQPWLDRGPWLAWPAALLIMLWFRRGWTMRWAALAMLYAGLAAPQPAQAAGIADWFLTPDQQGWLAYQRNDYGRAAELFSDPLWRGYAMYLHGQYEDAINSLDRVETAQAAVIQGMAYIRSRQYRGGVRSFELALKRDPGYPNAAENLKLAKEIVEYVETVREQSDTGEEQGIGADKIVFDNEANRGADTQIEANQEGAGLLTAEQWMNTVDTRTGDFLGQRFAIEAVRRGQMEIQQ